MEWCKMSTEQRAYRAAKRRRLRAQRWIDNPKPIQPQIVFPMFTVEHIYEREYHLFVRHAIYVENRRKEHARYHEKYKDRKTARKRARMQSDPIYRERIRATANKSDRLRHSLEVNVNKSRNLETRMLLLKEKEAINLRKIKRNILQNDIDRKRQIRTLFRINKHKLYSEAVKLNPNHHYADYYRYIPHPRIRKPRIHKPDTEEQKIRRKISDSKYMAKVPDNLIRRYLKLDDINIVPYELIEAKRAQILLYRSIRKAVKANME